MSRHEHQRCVLHASVDVEEMEMSSMAQTRVIKMQGVSRLSQEQPSCFS